MTADPPSPDGAPVSGAAAPGAAAPGARGGARSAPAAEARPIDLRLARLHLRTGALGLARAELEAAAGAGELDDEALVDLAEVRWRTGDVIGAGQAAAVHLNAGGEALVALVVAAEAAAIRGGAAGAAETEALVDRAVGRADLPMERVVAGMPLRAPWPLGVDIAGPAPEPLRDVAGYVEPSLGGRPAIPPLVPIGAGRAFADATHHADARAAGADPHGALTAGIEALAAGDREAAAFHFAVALRLSPALAPAVLAAVGGTPGPAFDLVRGDAFRLVGHESDARRAFAAVAQALAYRRDAPREPGGLASAPDSSVEPPSLEEEP